MVALVGLLLLALLLATTAGCAAPSEAAEHDPEPGPRFTVEYMGLKCHIITDNETGVQYLAYTTSYGTGLAVLQDGED
jgi:hypothetical protein